MKFTHTLVLLLLTVASSLAQEVFINPTSVTLTQQGAVTVIVTDNSSIAGADTVTVGSIQATNLPVSTTSNTSSSVTIANGAANGTLDAGNYPVTIDGNPQQVTVILWNEPSSSGGLSISQVQLVNTSGNTVDQISFQAFVASQTQQQIGVLQIQIASMQQYYPDAEIAPMQQQLVNLQSAYDQLTGELTITAVVTAQNGKDGANGSNARKPDDTLAYVGIGVGSAAFVGTIVNFFTRDDAKTDAPSSSSSSQNDK